VSNQEPLSSEEHDSQDIEQALEQYVPNMHLLNLDPALFTQLHFSSALEDLQQENQEKQKELILLYLTDEDLEDYKDAPLSSLIEVARHNLQLMGQISRLERKAKVSRYLMKK
jgi:hypothetical protein